MSEEDKVEELIRKYDAEDELEELIKIAKEAGLSPAEYLRQEAKKLVENK